MVITLQYHPHRLLLLDLEPETSPATRNSSITASNTGGDMNFDRNMVIVLAISLCDLLCMCALGLNSILRFSQRFGLETSEHEAATTRNITGLKYKLPISQIPELVYGDHGVKIPAKECPICLGEFGDGEKVRILPKCNHGFHAKCIDTWLAWHLSCPLCRRPLLDHLASDSDKQDEESVDFRQMG